MGLVIRLHIEDGTIYASLDGRTIYNETVIDDEIYIKPIGEADRSLSEEEIINLDKLRKNHPEIESWWIKNNILYLNLKENENSKEGKN